MNLRKDIKRAIFKKKFIYLLLCIQFCISITSALVGYAAWERHNKYKIINNSFTKLSDTYEFTISNDDIYNLTKSGEKILKEIKAETNYILGTYKVEEKAESGPYIKEDRYFTVISISSEFDKIYKLNLSEGKGNFEEGKKQVIAGYNLKEKYKLRDKVKVTSQGDEYEIIGFLANDSVFIENKSFNDTLVIKDYNLYNVFGHMYIQTKDEYKTVKNKIIKVTEKYGTLQFNKVDRLLFKEDLQAKEALRDNLILSIGIIIFSFSMFLCSLIIIINQSKRDFGIRIAYGAKKINLYCYIIGQVIFVYLVSMILMCIPYFIATKNCANNMGMSFSDYFNIKYFGVINLVIISLIFVISIPVMIKIHNLTPADLIRNKE